MRRIFAPKISEDLIEVKKIIKILSNLGVVDNLPKPKKRLNYDKLSLQSIRILNRLVDYLEDNNLTVDDIFADKIYKSNVKTQVKTEQVELIKDIDFFNKLFELELIV